MPIPKETHCSYDENSVNCVLARINDRMKVVGSPRSPAYHSQFRYLLTVQFDTDSEYDCIPTGFSRIELAFGEEDSKIKGIVNRNGESYESYFFSGKFMNIEVLNQSIFVECLKVAHARGEQLHESYRAGNISLFDWRVNLAPFYQVMDLIKKSGVMERLGGLEERVK